MRFAKAVSTQPTESHGEAIQSALDTIQTTLNGLTNKYSIDSIEAFPQTSPERISIIYYTKEA